MRQAVFEARNADAWSRLERWLDQRKQAKRAGRKRAEPSGLDDADVPRAYRQLCHHLALARDRAYSPDLVDRLNELALRGHHVLYGARSHRRGRLARFFLEDFPRRVRADWRVVALAALAFFGPVAGVAAALQVHPDFVHYLLAPRALAQIEEMYDPGNPRLGMRQADTNVMMFAFYVWNNVKIGFQCFATGLLFGLGSLFYLVSNGIQIGAVAGHLTHAGFGTPFWSFVSGHSALELVAIVLSGAAGLKLGAALVAPGNLSRRAALVAASREAIRIVYGAAAMFLAAAFVEAFWSPLTAFPPATKYAVGAILWALVLGYFALAGRYRAA